MSPISTTVALRARGFSSVAPNEGMFTTATFSCLSTAATSGRAPSCPVLAGAWRAVAAGLDRALAQEHLNERVGRSRRAILARLSDAEQGIVTGRVAVHPAQSPLPPRAMA
jgi:hypothetical protein